jgi:hypothetical protein
VLRLLVAIAAAGLLLITLYERYGTGGRLGLVSWDGMELAVGSG